jgi:signal transduction histidine kinase
MNLLDNAVKYSNKGGTLRFSCRASEDECEIIVENTGSPIPDSEQAHIFDRFYRADKSRGHDQAYELGSGAGLGLAIGRSIARIHGGDLVLVRSNNVSTIFSALIPRRQKK